MITKASHRTNISFPNKTLKKVEKENEEVIALGREDLDKYRSIRQRARSNDNKLYFACKIAQYMIQVPFCCRDSARCRRAKCSSLF